MASDGLLEEETARNTELTPVTSVQECRKEYPVILAGGHRGETTLCPCDLIYIAGKNILQVLIDLFKSIFTAIYDYQMHIPINLYTNTNYLPKVDYLMLTNMKKGKKRLECIWKSHHENSSIFSSATKKIRMDINFLQSTDFHHTKDILHKSDRKDSLNFLPSEKSQQNYIAFSQNDEVAHTPPNGWPNDACRNFDRSAGSINSKPIRGLKNSGNTCFMNSIVQCLSHTLPLRKFFVSNEYLHHLNNRGDFSFAFKRVMVELWNTTSGPPVSPSYLKRQVRKAAPIFSDKRQHDAHEFMRFLLNELHEEINRASEEGRKSPADNETLEEACDRYLTWEDSRISQLFSGMLRSDVSCSVCNNQSTAYVPFMDLSLPIPERNELNCSYYEHPVHLADCLKMITTEETLMEEESPYCNTCRDLTTSTKQLIICTLPRFLVIQLKRFSYYPTRTKLSTPVRFDDTWRLKDSSNSTHTYSLYGIACHSGSLYGGHYTAYCKYGGVWRCFNDSVTSIVSWEYVREQEAYILFYRGIRHAL